MKSIGGYLGLELSNGKELHKNAIRLNTGRNALEYILRARTITKIFIPIYTCDAIFEPIEKLNTSYEFYSINRNFEPEFDFENLKEGQAFLYTNYFGIKNRYIQKLAGHCDNLIIDNAQAFYAKPVEGVDTFYSVRKFFGVPDGAYLYPTQKLSAKFEEDTSFERFEHLLMRLDKNAEFGYPAYQKNEKLLANCDIKKMSQLTQKLLFSINYETIAKRRIDNFTYLHKKLKFINQLNITNSLEGAPLVYPLLTEKKDLRKKLIDKKIYPPRYWPNVLEWAQKGSLEYHFARDMVCLPIDQRYGKDEMDVILNELDF